jgi:hypothetical protein
MNRNINSNDVERMITNHEKRKTKKADILVELRKDFRLLVSDGVCQNCGNILNSAECQADCGVDDSVARGV